MKSLLVSIFSMVTVFSHAAFSADFIICHSRYYTVEANLTKNTARLWEAWSFGNPEILVLADPIVSLNETAERNYNQVDGTKYVITFKKLGTISFFSEGDKRAGNGYFEHGPDVFYAMEARSKIVDVKCNFFYK